MMAKFSILNKKQIFKIYISSVFILTTTVCDILLYWKYFNVRKEQYLTQIMDKFMLKILLFKDFF